MFMLGTSWHRYSWYLRLPGPGGSPWAGIVRVECAADLDPARAIALAHLSTATLPRSRTFYEKLALIPSL